jgi:tetratricopeptide (TPR) repeat protein
MNFWHQFKRWVGMPEKPDPVLVVSYRMTKLYNEAHAAFEATEYKRSEQLLREMLLEKDANVRADIVSFGLTLLHLVWLANEDHRTAVEFFTSRIHKDPQDAALYEYRACHEWYGAQQDKALADYDRAIALAPKKHLIRISRGQVYVELNDLEKAVDDLKFALEDLNRIPNARSDFWSQSQAYARNGLGAAFAAAGNLQEALHEFQLSIDLQPENAWVYFNRGRAWEKNGDKGKALADYRKALSLSNPKIPAYKRELAEERIKKLTQDSLGTHRP